MQVNHQQFMSNNMNPYRVNEPTVISFSGGRTSAFMLWNVIQANNGKLPDEAIVCFANTGKEDEATLNFVNDCSINWKVPIVWLEFRDDEKKFAIVDFESASRNGEPFEQLILKKKYLPNPFARFCTQDLKVIPIDRYLKSIGIEEYITFVGIRADEPRRVAKMKTNKDVKETPLATAGIGVQDVLHFWSKQSFDLQTITVDGNSLLSNCDLCFLKKANHTLALIKDKPQRAVWWAEMERKIGATFNPGHPTYAQMIQYSKDQHDMFDPNEETIACFCGD
jgi:3'-phosphoadenosine 5'-phosphosulfate sulfotransferase (PAPS reductase)/FAD synthetase